MILFPAIDIKGGKAVRLYQGRFDKCEEMGIPLEIAKEFEKTGAEFIHLVDLDGAKEGKRVNSDIIKAIAKTVNIPVQLGGGIRTLEDLEAIFDLGVSRAIIGTAAYKDKEFLIKAVEKYGEKIAVGVDAKDNKVALEGWLESTNMDYIEFSRQLEKIGVKTVIYTDISKDGTLEGANIEGLKALSDAVNMDIVASGGVKDLEDLLKIKELNLYGAISGKAIYSGSLDLKEALDALKG
ncbi:1-(5-phosphoribosyl)-5-[(5-phosphoribosylamino)methylideneamino]imidazole-4-carboxamide isomerase [Clostridium bornimense]|uniref:1-(5-phosphoribosyl)-5-[(5- phosphoribosylamino)methylideneamino]imidazole-4- carboxamide isomerase n=1 Tax=Clostridium bornimense TaxID=1216932 RepID=UPI001C0F5E3B|nr:1-(5-phosphoribosyl)-5-[(5-phosphoribosylamino)methylideneamino]imidazole-4-carboxamide isomerase [Clostridium bornimense]MBU5315522.1 1-(5-phosphoribosyl)-5-[(5-phosphoribosylamino)methylideneamino]imidazole-4-carboxamide isomerase [Clostridium bornimense]